MRAFINTELKIGRRKLKAPIRKEQMYFLLLSDQTCIIGREFDIMRQWRKEFRDKAIVDMYATEKRTYTGVTSLSKFIEYDPKAVAEGMSK